MHIVLETLWVILLTIYYWLEAIVLTFVPASTRRKSVKGEKVLITGSGEKQFINQLSVTVVTHYFSILFVQP